MMKLSGFDDGGGVSEGGRDGGCVWSIADMVLF